MSETREPLNRDRVAGAALAFIDRHGEPALSMRKLGAELGVEAMSLYNHVANKDDLLDAVGDLIYGEILAAYEPDLNGTWQDDLRELGYVYRDTAHRHPNALSLVIDRVIPSPVKYLFLSKCYGIFTKAGFDTKAAAVAFDTAASWVIGAIRQEMGLMADLAARHVPDAADLPPELKGVVDFATACLAWTPGQRFEYGLETMVAGLEWRLSNS
jgi:TetR/AcrR family tetracycline transcriptional repressor